MDKMTWIRLNNKQQLLASFLPADAPVISISRCEASMLVPHDSLLFPKILGARFVPLRAPHVYAQKGSKQGPLDPDCPTACPPRLYPIPSTFIKANKIHPT